MKKENKYCVYMYYIDNIPIYVGMGNSKRPYQHLQVSEGSRQNYFYKNLRLDIDCGRELTIKVIKTGLTLSEAYTIEEILVELCGRIDKGTGTLYNKTAGGKNFPTIPRKNGRKVIQYTLNGDLVRTWNSLGEAGENCNTTRENIWAALKANKTAAGFQWKYYTEPVSLKISPIVSERSKCSYKPKQVQVTLPNNEVRVYKSAVEAAKNLQLNTNRIRFICRGERPPLIGYTFTYLKDIQ